MLTLHVITDMQLNINDFENTKNMFLYISLFNTFFPYFLPTDFVKYLMFVTYSFRTNFISALLTWVPVKTYVLPVTEMRTDCITDFSDQAFTGGHYTQNDHWDEGERKYKSDGVFLPLFCVLFEFCLLLFLFILEWHLIFDFICFPMFICITVVFICVYCDTLYGSLMRISRHESESVWSAIAHRSRF